MEHQEAIQMLAAERYLLGELTDAERDQFEEHFFDCPECAEDVRGGNILTANLRAVFADNARQSDAKPGRWEWFRLRPAWVASIASAAAVLTGGVVFEGVLIYQLRSQLAVLRVPQSYSSVFLRSTTRGAEQVIAVPRESHFLALSMDLTPGQNYPHYLGEVSDESGGILFSVPLERPRTPDESLNLLLPVSSLEPGRLYKIVIHGLGERAARSVRTEIASYHFSFQRD